MYTRYESMVRKLYQINMFHPGGAVKYGLDNSFKLSKLLGSPMAGKPIIHVAGTNGKGSVSWKMARALRDVGYRDGLFVSPHVASFRERVQVTGEYISEDEVSDGLSTIFSLCEANSIPATFFEVTTALAFHHFQHKADVVVLEVGLGGRLDATNVVTPSLAVITSIGLDHCKILGDTVELIAVEKAGIMKPGVPVLVGPRVPSAVLEACAAAAGSPYHTTAGKTTGEGREGSAYGDFDEENSAIARAALNLLRRQRGFERLDQRSIDAGVSSRPPCRFEVLRVCWDPLAATASLETPPSPGSGGLKACAVVLDVGHNPPALAELAKMLARRFGGQPLRLVLGMSRDKDLEESLKLALRQPLVKHVHLVAAPHPRAAPPSQLLKAAQASADHANRRDPDNFFSVHEGAPGSVARGVRAAVAAAAGRGEVVVVCGSVFVMAEAREALGFKEPRDTPCIDEMAGSNTRSAAEHAASSASP